MSNEKKEESNEEIDLAQLYKKKGKKLRDSMDQVKEQSKNKIRDRLIELDEDFPLLPDTLKQYILSIKVKTGLPRTLFPQKYFTKPRFRGKRDFFQRLATDVLNFGLTQQRITGQPFLSKKDFATQFLHKKQEWNCEPKDVLHALKILLNNDIIFMKNKKLFFEPIRLSKNINEVLIFVKENNIESLAFEELEKRLSWNQEKVHSTLFAMEQNDLIILDQDTAYFPFIGE